MKMQQQQSLLTSQMVIVLMTTEEVHLSAGSWSHHDLYYSTRPNGFPYPWSVCGWWQFNTMGTWLNQFDLNSRCSMMNIHVNLIYFTDMFDEWLSLARAARDPWQTTRPGSRGKCIWLNLEVEVSDPWRIEDVMLLHEVSEGSMEEKHMMS